jgi:chromosome transmission fidelity protein 1
LPYPDITNPELKEKMAAMDRAAATTTTGGAGTPKTRISGQAYYHNLCMRAVNQSVGRAIRHANDYAAVVLVDARYRSDQRVWGGLPGWLKKGVSKNWNDSSCPFEARLQEIQDFFKTRREVVE